MKKVKNDSSASYALALDERLDFQNLGSFKAEIGNLLSDMEVKNVVVDCKDLVYIDGAGLGAIATAHVNAICKGKSLELRNCGLRLQKVLRVGYLGQLISCSCPPENS